MPLSDVHLHLVRSHEMDMRRQQQAASDDE
jgi:hypothetical protein